MADGTIAITAGSGETVDVTDISVGGSTVARQRMVIAGNADAAGLLELPDHDAADSGPPLKIGGRAQRSVPTAVSAAADRVNAWFTREGQLGVVATVEAGTVYSNDATNGGRIATASICNAVALNNSATAVVGAQASLRTYVTSVVFLCSAFTGAGYVTLRNDATDIFPVSMGVVLALNLGSYPHVAAPGTFLCRTTANTALNIFCSGNATIKYAISYFVAP